MAVYAVGGRDNHFAEAHVGRNAGVLEQNAALHLGALANAAAVAYPAGADDAGAGLDLAPGHVHLRHLAAQHTLQHFPVVTHAANVDPVEVARLRRGNPALPDSLDPGSGPG